MRDLPGAKALARAVVVALSLSLVLSVVSDVAPVYATSVTQPIIVATPSGGSAFTYTVSGCSVYPTSGTSGPSSSPFVATPSCLLKVTMPSADANTRYVFAPGAPSTTVSTCSSGTCATFSPSDYYQLAQTYTASSANAFPASSRVNLEGTQSGTFTTTACSISTGGTTSASCASGSSWFDYDTPVGFTSLSTQGTSTHQFSATLLTYGLVAYWPLDEPTPGACTKQVMDLSGSGLTGTCENSPTFVSGRYGGALSFDGASSYVQAPVSSLLSPEKSGALTITAWFYPTTTSLGCVAGKDSGFYEYCMLAFGGAGLYTEAWLSGGATACNPGTSNSVTENAWNFGVLEIDFTHSVCYVQLNNGAVASGAIGGSMTATSSYFDIGRRGDGALYFKGYIDEVRAYDDILSTSQLGELYLNAPHSIIFTDTTGGNIHEVTFYSQFADSAQYTVNGGGSPTAPYLTGVSIGWTMTSFLQLTTSPQTVWLDAGSAWSTTSPKTNSISFEQWEWNAASGTTLGDAVTTMDPTYMLTYNTPIIALVTVAVGVSLVAAVLAFRRYLTFTWRQ